MTLLSRLSFPEVRAVIEAGAVALWPIGSTEAHGPHLPLDTDVRIAEETVRRASAQIRNRRALGSLVLPTLSITVTDCAKPFAGTLSLPHETALAYVRDTILSIAAQGVRAVCLVNAHLEPAHRFMLRDAVKAAKERSPCPVGIADPADARFAATLTEEFKSGNCHAGQYETSLILAAEGGADQVREKLRGGLPDNDANLLARLKGGAKDFLEAGMGEAYAGAPARATREEGERSYQQLTEIVLTVVGELLGPVPERRES
jgi:creatinine amidohydrolase